jgi:farnesyl diphosphate synthase
MRAAGSNDDSGGPGNGQGSGPGGGDGGSDGRLAAALAHAAAVVEAALDNLLPIPEGAESRLLEAMRYATLGGGKRLRAFLVLQSASLFGVAETCAARVGAAVEMLHAYSLVHDDLPAMDNDDLRRGKPSTHRAYDEATAILVGDALQTRAFEVLAEADTHSDAHARCELIHALAVAAGARGMAGGQMIDMLAPARQQAGEPLEAPEVTRLQALKTGRLIQFCAEAGAILGRAPTHQRHLLGAYGRDVGAAFQIADDLLDAEASTDTLGKTAGKDAASGKATLVAVLGPERARAHAEMLASQAAEHLDSFGARAEVLQALAAHVVARSH